MKIFKNTLSRKFTFVFALITSLFIVSAVMTYALTSRRKYDSNITEVLTEQRSLVNKYVRDFFYYLKTNDISKVSNTIKKFEKNSYSLILKDENLKTLSNKTLKKWDELKKHAGKIIQGDDKSLKSYNLMLQISNQIDHEYSLYVFNRHKEYSKDWKIIFLFQLISVVVIIVISILVLIQINQKIVAGINEVKNAAIQLSKGKFFNLSNNFSDDEVGQLAHAIKSTNSLIDKLNYQQDKLKVEISEKQKIQAQMIANEKLASLGTISSGIAHELRNPLNFILNFSKALVLNIKEVENLEEAKEEFSEISEIINKHALRANKIINQMLGHTSNKKQSKEKVELESLIESSLNLSYKSLLVKRNIPISFVKNYDPLKKLEISPNDFSTAITNIFENSIHSLVSKSDKEIDFRPVLKIELKAFTIEEKVKLIIEDNGDGISQDIIQDIFDPFYTTKPTGEGSGLGLTMCHDIITSHDGKIKIESEEGSWTRVTIELPTSKKSLIES